MVVRVEFMVAILIETGILKKAFGDYETPYNQRAVHSCEYAISLEDSFSDCYDISVPKQNLHYRCIKISF